MHTKYYNDYMIYYIYTCSILRYIISLHILSSLVVYILEERKNTNDRHYYILDSLDIINVIKYCS